MDFETIVRMAPDQLSTSVGEDAVILNLDRGAYYGLNNSGAGLWQKLQQPTRVGALHEWLVATYEVAPEVAHRDLFVLLNKLADLKLIEVVHAGSPSVDEPARR
jgi:hypothetical protein